MTSIEPQNPESIRKLIFDIACALVDEEDKVIVRMEEVGTSHVISVEVATGDLGKMMDKAAEPPVP